MSESATIIQEWHGYIEDVYDDYFSVVLIDYTNPDNPDMRAEFPNHNISQNEMKFVREGQCFIWRIFNYGNGTTESQIEFTHGKPITQEDIDELYIKARELREKLGWLE